MELRQLEYVVTLADELSFRRASERLAIAQSGLSQQLKRLERELGVPLFDRSTHHVALTQAGAAFVSEARRTLEAAERAREVARRAARTSDRLVVCVGDATMDTMPTVLESVRAELPHLEVATVVGGLPRQREMLRNGDLDLGLALLDGDPGPGLAARLLRREPMGVVVGEHHPLAGAEQVRWCDLGDVTLLVGSEDEHPEYNAFVRGLLAEAGVAPTMSPCGTVPEAVEGVRSGAGLLCVPELPVLPPGVRWRPLVQPTTGLPTSLVWRRHDDRPLLRRVLDLASDTGRSSGWLGDHRD
ncbi:LysR family transcriptional regulator [Nocardioides sp. CN2-186]|uniref:LysR family transcriptional regulator n=1 Tax=Nocardioides tweenelious TaxID=3156607 RepID=UPI0032B5080C